MTDFKKNVFESFLKIEFAKNDYVFKICQVTYIRIPGQDTGGGVCAGT